MKKILFVWMLCCGLAACNRDDQDTHVSYKDMEWYVVEDSDDELDHLIYEVYKSTGIPLFYKDTIRSRTEVNEWGGEYTLYSILNPNYMIESMSKLWTFTKSTDREKLKKGVELFRDKVYPKLPKGYRSACYLLVDQLRQKEFYTDVVGARKGMNTTVIGRVAEMDAMSEEEQERLAWEVVAEEVYDSIQAYYPKDLDAFFNVSFVLCKKKDVYSDLITKFKTNIPNYNAGSNGAATDPREAGFLRWWQSKRYTPEYKDDVCGYLIEVLLGDDEGFAERNAGFNGCLEKYDMIKAIAVDMGLRR
ncbi:hypothetical protein [Butyricimonas synergistica]|uniref:hypothetical protein n=1 Tax=Butyricimonas synergistica TaxID=544644 RepID=UPI0003A22968|nr:hypothetical protein [Butyricimonas synergistica]